MNAESIIKGLESVTAKWTKQRKQEERGRPSAAGSLHPLVSRDHKDAAAEIIRPVYEEWSDDGRGGLVPVTAQTCTTAVGCIS